MAYENYGTAGVSGAYATLSWTGLDTNCQVLVTSIEVTHDYGIKNDLIQPNTGEVIGNASGREMFSARVSGIAVSKTTHSVTNAAKAMIAPASRCKVTITNSRNTDVSSGTPATGLDWIYDGGFTVSETGDGFATVSMNLVRYTATGSDATTLTTAV